MTRSSVEPKRGADEKSVTRVGFEPTPEDNGS